MLCILMHRGRKTSTHYFPCSGGHCVISRKSTPARYTELLFFASGGIYESRRAFWCVRAAKHNHTIFKLRWAQCGFKKKRVGTCYAELVLHPVGCACQVVQSGASGVQNVDALCFMLRWARCGFHKKCVGARCAELVFFASGGIWGHVVHSSASEVRNIITLFFMLEWAWCYF
jgi:hypothetical protein